MKNFVPKDPNYKNRVEASFNRQKFMKFIGAQLTSLRPGFCEIQLTYKDELTQQHGYFHAGVIGTLADNAGGYAAFTLMNADSSILTVEYKLNLISPGKGDKLISRANVIKSGRTLTICRSEVFSSKSGREKLCAASQMTLIELQRKADHA
jgi:uncharacterized protein (TIGR00369 family)